MFKCLLAIDVSVLNCLCSFPLLFIGNLMLLLLLFGVSSSLIKDITLCPVWSKYFPWFICLLSNFEKNCNLYVKYLLLFSFVMSATLFELEKFSPQSCV